MTSNEVEALSLTIANNVLGLEIWDYDNYHIFFPIEKSKKP